MPDAPEPAADDAAATPELTAVEVLKAGTNYLRDPLVAEFAAGGTHISEAGYQILKFHGSYQQDDRDVRNDRRRAGQAYDFSFMIRLRLPSGDIHPDLWLALDDLAGRFGRDTIRLTTRQSVQLHFIPKAELRSVIAAINANLASTLGACGDVNRNVMAAPLPTAGGRYAVVREAARAIADHLLPRTPAYAELWLNGEQVARIGPPEGSPAPEGEVALDGGSAPDGSSAPDGGSAPDVHSTAPTEIEPLYGATYLPRKFKTCVTVAGDNSVDLFTHDLGLAGIFDGDALIGWNVYAGGGLGRTHRKPATFPRLADALGFIEPERLLETAAAIVAVQRDHGDRTNRRHARLKYLIHDRGIDWFRGQVEAAAGFRLAAPRTIDWDRFDDRIGWHEQGDGRWFLGLRIENGRIRDGDGARLRTALRSIAGELRLPFRITPNQNLYVLDVAGADRGRVADLLADAGIAVDGDAPGLRRLSMACPALPTCGLAVTDAERALPDLLDDLQGVFDGAGVGDANPTVRMTGCPNGCARPYVAEIGFVGDAVNRYQVWLGGDGAGTRLAIPVADRVPKAELPAFLEPLVRRYAGERDAGEGFGDFVVRAGLASPEGVAAAQAAEPATDGLPAAGVAVGEAGA
jgi:sulfite reductase (ferredoxin)